MQTINLAIMWAVPVIAGVLYTLMHVVRAGNVFTVLSLNVPQFFKIPISKTHTQVDGTYYFLVIIFYLFIWQTNGTSAVITQGDVTN